MEVNGNGLLNVPQSEVCVGKGVVWRKGSGMGRGVVWMKSRGVAWRKGRVWSEG